MRGLYLRFEKVKFPKEKTLGYTGGKHPNGWENRQDREERAKEEACENKDKDLFLLKR
jgi:hypothetical protein